MALLCTQSVKLHVHDLDHGLGQQHEHAPGDGAVEHLHLAEAHLSIDTSHADHHGEVVSEIDLSPDVLLKNISVSQLTLAIFAILLILPPHRMYRHSSHRRRKDFTVLMWRYHLSPPLRAPPL